MADRVLTWFIPDSPNPVSLPRYYMDADYEKVGLRVYAEQAPVEDDLGIDIQADGVSIFQNQSSTTFTTGGQRTTTPVTTPVLNKGETSQDDAPDFNDDLIPAESWVSCVISDMSGAKRITIQLELDKVDEQSE